MRTALCLLLLASPPTGGHVVDLPELAAGKWYLTVVIADPPQQDDIDLLNFMRTKQMEAVQTQLVYNEWADSKPIVKSTSWSTFLGQERPAVLLQSQHDQDGKADVVFFAAGEAVNPATLAGDLQKAINKYQSAEQCPGGRCPRPILPNVPLPRRVPPHGPQPQPQPGPDQPDQPKTPAPEIKPITPTVQPPDKKEEPEPAEASGIPVWMFALPVVAAGAGLWRSFDHS